MIYLIIWNIILTLFAIYVVAVFNNHKKAMLIVIEEVKKLKLNK